MTPDQLRRLGELSKSSASKAHDFLDEVIAELPHVGIQRKGKGNVRRHYRVQRVGDDYGAAGGAPEIIETKMAIKSLLQVSGIGLDQAPSLADPSIRGVNSHPVHEHPDVQALACMRLLLPDYAQDSQWIAIAAGTRITRLLVEFPGLLHPRLGFAWRDPKDTIEPKPMLMFLASSPVSWSLLPCIGNDGLAEVQVREFACHPLLASAMRAKQPSFEFINANCDGAGETPLSFMVRKPVLVGPLLALDRMRHEATGKRSMLRPASNSAPDIFLLAIGHAANRVWEKSRGPQVHDASSKNLLTSELALSPTFPANTSRLIELLDASSRIFKDANPFATATQGAAAGSDGIGNFERLRALLVDSGSVSDGGAAACEIFRSLFPYAGEGYKVSNLLGRASDQEAMHIVKASLDAGFDIDDLGARIRKWQVDDSSTWLRALTVFETERRMHTVIGDVTADSDITDASAPARRARVL
ncbi:hypothetical protein ABIC83_002725 [Roseateles asaccharophilus]|uniref:hypothetical protein n=1 Tax=Roseateles asaccharophilus TaxID=582607 RepID=UPI003836F958